MRYNLIVLGLVFVVQVSSTEYGITVNASNEYGSVNKQTGIEENSNGAFETPWFEKSSAREFLKDFEPELRNFYLRIFRKYRNRNRNLHSANTYKWENNNNAGQFAKMTTENSRHPDKNVQRRFYPNRFTPYYNNWNQRQWTTRYPYWRDYYETYNQNRRMVTSNPWYRQKTTRRRFYPNRSTPYYNNWNQRQWTTRYPYWRDDYETYNPNRKMVTSNPWYRQKTTRRRFYPNRFTPYYNNWNQRQWTTEYWRRSDDIYNRNFRMTTIKPWYRVKTTRMAFYPNRFTLNYNHPNRRQWNTRDKYWGRRDKTIREKNISKIKKSNEDSYFWFSRPNSFWFEVGLVIVSGIAFILFISLCVSLYNSRKLALKLKKGKTQTSDGHDNMVLQMDEMPPSYYESVENEPIVVQNV